MQVWLGADGRLRGIASLDSITPDEFSGAFARWPVSVTGIEPADVESAICAAIRPEIVACSSKGGYQPIKFSLKRQSVSSIHSGSREPRGR